MFKYCSEQLDNNKNKLTLHIHCSNILFPPSTSLLYICVCNMKIQPPRPHDIGTLACPKSSLLMGSFVSKDPQQEPSMIIMKTFAKSNQQYQPTIQSDIRRGSQIGCWFTMTYHSRKQRCDHCNTLHSAPAHPQRDSDKASIFMPLP